MKTEIENDIVNIYIEPQEIKDNVPSCNLRVIKKELQRSRWLGIYNLMEELIVYLDFGIYNKDIDEGYEVEDGECGGDYYYISFTGDYKDYRAVDLYFDKETIDYQLQTISLL